MLIKDILQDSKFSNKYVLKELLKYVLWYSTIQLYKNREQEISKNTITKINQKYNLYELKNIPLEYIVWYTFFMWKKIIVDNNTLIPRPETEYLINYALKFIEEKNKNYDIFDIWTWSGIIWNILWLKLKTPIICSDITKKTLHIAKKNDFSQKNKFFISNLWDHLQNYKKNMIICSNLPYVKTSFKLDNFSKKEPSKALFAGEDGLDLYKKLLNQIFQLDNKKIICFFEITNKQGKNLIKTYNLNGELLNTCHKNIKILKIKIIN